MKNIFLLIIVNFIFIQFVNAQKTFPQNGPYDVRQDWYAITNATIYKKWDEKIENASLLIKNGKVEACGKSVVIPTGATIIDLKGKYIYPSFIDLYCDYGIENNIDPNLPNNRRNRSGGPNNMSSKKGAFSWNEALKSEQNAIEMFLANKEKAKGWLSQGFGSVLTHKMDGISRGTSTLVTLGDDNEHELILKSKAAHQLSFKKGSSSQDYPSSLMGSIALLRQTYYDGQWYKNQNEEVNLSLAAWNDLQPLCQIFDVDDKQDLLRASKLGKEFAVNYIIKGAGDEYQRLDEIKAAGNPLILPINFPNAMDVEDPLQVNSVNYGDLLHWELAPTNLGLVDKAGIEFCITSFGLSKKEDFLLNLKKAISYGLSEDAALKALTATPAKLISVENIIGSLENGKVANFIITNTNIFSKDGKVLNNWVNGKPVLQNDLEPLIISGNYNLILDGNVYKAIVKNNSIKPDISFKMNDSTDIKLEVQLTDNLLVATFQNPDKSGITRLQGVIENKINGVGINSNNRQFNWSMEYLNASNMDSSTQDKKPNIAELGKVVYPFMTYGWTKKPTANNYLIKNCTIWTNEIEGKLINTDLLLQNGKIAKVGKNIFEPNAIIIDGTDKQITAGIIDEHSHIAASRGINEGTQESSAEVRIGDIINADDINIYRQLAGGVTTSHILHGSANPIGGQTQLIKLRWGYSPEAMKFEGADGFIKFALGENVKRASYQDPNNRFPQTRMGVEQVYNDYFTRAREYERIKKSGKPYRKDLDLEAILEILDKKRFITCHSYVQSEINMLMKMAEKHSFRVNTFTHILEGYKVADKMVRHGVGGSTFSDWWAYKHEVYDAIPYNGALMHDQGVVVAFNSDDAEMARRLNQEAGKAIMYGNVKEEDALKFVTLNPAKLLHIDHRVGSIKVGKDADVVIWSGHPLSVYSKAEMTFVDGIKFYDRSEESKVINQFNAEKFRLIQKMMESKKAGNKVNPIKNRPHRYYHCEDIEDEMGDVQSLH
mgnify:CR=1 FL=1